MFACTLLVLRAQHMPLHSNGSELLGQRVVLCLCVEQPQAPSPPKDVQRWKAPKAVPKRFRNSNVASTKIDESRVTVLQPAIHHDESSIDGGGGAVCVY